MKRAKIMLVTIAVLATVGGALAFKANKFGNTRYCYTVADQAPPQGAGNCPSFAGQSSMVDFGEQSIWYTTTNSSNPTACQNVTTCPSFAEDIIQ